MGEENAYDHACNALKKVAEGGTNEENVFQN